MLKILDMPEFPIHYYRHILAKYWTHGKMTSFLPFVLVKILDSPWKYWTVGRYAIDQENCYQLMTSYNKHYHNDVHGGHELSSL